MRRKGLEDLNVYSTATATRRKGPADLNITPRFCCLKQDGQDEQDGQDRAAQAYREKV